LATQRDRHLK